MMSEVRPIDATWLKSWVEKECNPYGNPTIGFGDGRRFMEQIDKMPTLESEVRHGRWEYRHADDWMFCTACGVDAEGNFEEPLETDYCPHCGAKMDGGNGND